MVTQRLLYTSQMFLFSSFQLIFFTNWKSETFSFGLKNSSKHFQLCKPSVTFINKSIKMGKWVSGESQTLCSWLYNHVYHYNTTITRSVDAAGVTHRHTDSFRFKTTLFSIFHVNTDSVHINPAPLANSMGRHQNQSCRLRACEYVVFGFHKSKPQQSSHCWESSCSIGSFFGSSVEENQRGGQTCQHRLTNKRCIDLLPLKCCSSESSSFSWKPESGHKPSTKASAALK